MSLDREAIFWLEMLALLVGMAGGEWLWRWLTGDRE